jgi:curved DNA-binding protein CbpA
MGKSKREGRGSQQTHTNSKSDGNDTKSNWNNLKDNHFQSHKKSKESSSWSLLLSLSLKVIFLFSYALLSGGYSRFFLNDNENNSENKDGKLGGNDGDKDPYEILELDRDVTDLDVIKKTYRKLALKYHPDRMNGKTDEEKIEAEEKMKNINWAYENLQKFLDTSKVDEDKNEDQANDNDETKDKHNNTRDNFDRKKRHNSKDKKNTNRKEAYDNDDNTTCNKNKQQHKQFHNFNNKKNKQRRSGGGASSKHQHQQHQQQHQQQGHGQGDEDDEDNIENNEELFNEKVCFYRYI